MQNDDLGGESECEEICDEQDRNGSVKTSSKKLSIEELEEIVLMNDELFERIMIKKRAELKEQLKEKERESDAQ